MARHAPSSEDTLHVVAVADRRPRFRPSFPLVEAKLRPPAAREGTIGRDRIVRRLIAAQRLPVATITAPPGYGKTLVLAELAARDARPVAWLSLDEFDNESTVFLTYLAAALDRIQPLSQATATAVRRGGQRVLASCVPRLAAELHLWREPGTLVLDDVHRLVAPGCLDALAALIDHLPEGFQVVLAGRMPPDLPLARWFAERSLLEIDREDLALDAEEVVALATAAGRPLGPARAAQLVRATEGWAAGVYLSLMAGPVGGDMVVADGPKARERVAQYVRSELLATLDEDSRRLLTRTSILEVVEPDVADAVVATSGSAGRLDALARANGLVTRTSGTDRSYRCHALLRDVLLDDLERSEGAMIPELHRRAAGWYGAVGREELAIEHALAGGDRDQAASLLATSVMRTYFGGHADLLERWLREIGDDTFERHPGPAMVASLVYAMFGMAAESERLAQVVERSQGIGPDERSMRLMIRSMHARGGAKRAQADASDAVASEPEWGVWPMFGRYCLALGHIMLGQAEAADGVAASAIDAALAGGNAPFYGLAIRSSLAMERGDWTAAAAFARQSHEDYDRTGLGDVVTAILVHAVSARAAFHRGDVALGRQELVHAQVAQVAASRAVPGASVLSQLEVARAYLAAGDMAGARHVIGEATTLLRARPDLGLLGAQVEAVRSCLDRAPYALAGASTLTAAELRVLPALSTPLSFKEIGERLYLSPHTIKTHAMSIYGKLDASSRSEAVERAIELGLLDPFPRVPARPSADPG